MTYEDFLNKIIDDGIEECKIAYADQTYKLRGCLEGFNACRGKNDVELSELLTAASEQVGKAYGKGNPGPYWQTRMKLAQIEFVCNVVSAVLMNNQKKPIIAPTAIGMQKAASILRVQ